MRRALTLAVAVLVLLPITACTSLPEDGPIVDAGSEAQIDVDEASDINAVPPVPGASSVDIVQGFLDAMTASPIRVDIAQQFLTTAAAASWNPDESTITYAGLQPLREEGSQISVPLSSADRLDRIRAWRGALSPADAILRFSMVREGGEWRIANPPNALIVPTSWFTQRFRQAVIYLFDPTGSILVPEPVFVPRGEQLVTSLVNALVARTPRDSGVVVSFVPPGLTSQPVPVSGDGIADVALEGEAGPLSAADTERLLAQLAWTLSQAPGVESVRVAIGDRVLPSPTGGAAYPVASAQRFDPGVSGASQEMFGIQDGVLARRSANEMEPVSGPLGQPGADPRSAAVDLTGGRVAAVNQRGTVLLLGSVDDTDGGDGDGPGAEQDLLRPFTRGTDLLRPAWDFAGRIWFVDRTPDGAVVRYLDADRTAHVVDVPGVSGRQVEAFLVSRDGTRLVSVVRSRLTDRLLVSRVAADARGDITGAETPERLVPDRGLTVRIRGIGWTSPTTLTLATPVVPGEVFDVRSVSVDGSPVPPDALSTRVQAPLVGLATSPTEGLPAYGVTRTSLVDLAGGTYGFVGAPPTSLGYVG